jgi:hypothetical protein
MIISNSRAASATAAAVPAAGTNEVIDLAFSGEISWILHAGSVAPGNLPLVNPATIPRRIDQNRHKSDHN